MSGRDLLGLPLAALAVFTGAKSFRDNPVLGNRWYETRFVKTELVDEGWAEGLHPASVSRA